MEKGWPPLEECVQYESGMIRQYLQKFYWEDDEEDATESEYSSEEDEDGNRQKYSYKPSSIKEFLNEVRTTRGYSADTRPPGLMQSPFMRVERVDFPIYELMFSKAIEAAINYISSETRWVYKHVDILNVVDTPHRILLMTFTAKKTTAKFIPKSKKKKEKEEKKKKKEKKKKEKKEVTPADDGEAETFLAAIYAPVANAPTEDFEVRECFRKPKATAPWKYIEPPVCGCGCA